MELHPTDNPIELERRVKAMGLSMDTRTCGVARSEPRNSRQNPRWIKVVDGKFGGNKFADVISST